MKAKHLVSIASLLIVSLASQAELVEVHHQGQVETKSMSSARKEITLQAVEEISERYITELIGEKKLNKNKTEIKSKIIKNYLKYIPILKVTGLKRAPQGTEAEVFMKVSIDNLKELLLRAGLLYEMKGAPIVLPMVSVIDRVNSKSFVWWSGSYNVEQMLLREWVSHFHKQLKIVLSKKNFFSLQPVKWNMDHQVPKVFQSDKPRTEDLLFLSQQLMAPIIVKGEYKVSRVYNLDNRFTINVKLEALQASNGRVIGEVIRSYETNTGNFQVVVNDKILTVNEGIAKDLSRQIVDAWKKGTFGSSLIQLTINGRLNYRQLENFKKLIQQKVREVRGLRERFLSAGAYTFEVDSSLPASELAKAIGRKKFPSYKVEVDEVKANRLALNINIR